MNSSHFRQCHNVSTVSKEKKKGVIRTMARIKKQASPYMEKLGKPSSLGQYLQGLRNHTNRA